MGKLYRFHNDVDTDQIIASQYLLFPTIDEMKTHTFESLDPDFASKAKPGDYVVACENFGCGSFARIFYRNAINIGLPVIVCKDLYDHVADGDEMELDLEAGTITSGGQTFTCTKLPAKMQSILDQGGLIASLNKED